MHGEWSLGGREEMLHFSPLPAKPETGEHSVRSRPLEIVLIVWFQIRFLKFLNV